MKINYIKFYIVYKLYTRDLRRLRVTLGDFRRLWAILGPRVGFFSEILKQAKSGVKTRIESDPFYTEKYGYKFKIQLKPDGSSTGKGTHLSTHLSVYFIMMKGEYDAVLLWPFRKKVTFMLIDQQTDPNDRENIVMSLSTDLMGWNLRPLTSENNGIGFPKFVSHNKLRERRFIVDDTIFIKGKIAPPQ